MSTKFILVTAIAGMLWSCQSQQTAKSETAPETTAEAAREARLETEKAKAALAKRINQLDAQIDEFEADVKKSSKKTKVKLTEKVRELRAEAKKLRDHMSTWDDKAESAWHTTKREVENGLDKAESEIKEFVNDLKG